MRSFIGFTVVLIAVHIAAFRSTDSTAGTTPDSSVRVSVVTTDTMRYAVLMQGNQAGQLLVWTDADGVHHESFRFNDRGRGPELSARARLGERGLPVELEVEGLDYLKSPVEERFLMESGAARWRNQGEEGSQSDGAALYIPMNGTPGMFGLVARALLEAEDGCLPLLPGGKACIERVQELDLSGEAGASGHPPEAARAVLYAITGLGFEPQHVWLDVNGSFFATAGGWLNVVREDWTSEVDRLAAAEREAQDAWLRELASRLPERPAGSVAIVGVRVFDPHRGESRPSTTVILDGNRIAAVGPDGEVNVPEDARVIEAAGQTLLPGLFDMHVHLSPIDGILHLAAGVTSVRDLANDIERLQEMRAGFEKGEAIGPRVIMAGFMDGPGAFAGPTKVLVDTEDEARDWIDRYADLGYGQIKVYSSVDTALIPVIIEAAHGRGLRVSGHIPAFMTAERAVRAGFDEIQHVNMLFLNFLGDTLDTRTPLRFTEVASHGAALDLNSDSVRAFIRLLRDREVVVDPTVAVFEGMFTARSGTISPSFAVVADRLPPQVRRGFLTGGLPVPDGMDERYRESFRRMLDLVAALHRAGVRIVPGTDGLAGFTYHRELELYRDAGIPAIDVLRIATLGAAEVAGRASELGSVEVGKLADLVLVDGDPTTEIAAIRRTRLVIKDGLLYDPAQLFAAIGVKPISARD